MFFQYGLMLNYVFPWLPCFWGDRKNMDNLIKDLPYKIPVQIIPVVSEEIIKMPDSNVKLC